MKTRSKTFQEILEEKLQEPIFQKKEFSTNRIKIEEKIPFFFENLSVNLKKIPTYPKPKPISLEEKLKFWLDKCATNEEKNAIKFFFNLGEHGFLFDRSSRVLDKSFRKLASKVHPDRFHNYPKAVIDQKKSEFIELRAHYIVLKKLAKHL